jgi:hypothetical protein
LFNSILRHPELILGVSQWLDPLTLCRLYGISKPFHYLMNSTYMTFITANARIWAPHAFTVFPFSCFRDLCILDPGYRPLIRDPTRIRHIPGFRWLKMATQRQRTTDMILFELARSGHRLPIYTHIAVQKMWMTMLLSSNGARIGLMHNRSYWTDEHLFLALCFVMKLDMRFTEPTTSSGELLLRECFLAKRSLWPLLILLRNGYSPLQLVQHFISYEYRVQPQFRGMSVMGVSAHLLGAGSREGWGAGTDRMLRVDELLPMELMRRGVAVNRYIFDMMLYGTKQMFDNLPLSPDSSRPRFWFSDQARFVKLVNWHLANLPPDASA